MSTINYPVIAARLTTERLRSYHQSTSDLAGAIRLYDWNAAMAGALHEDLGRLEVVFRNSLDAALVRYGSERAWPTVWYQRSQLFPGRPHRRIWAVITEARQRATFGGIPERHGKVIAELPFGFWRYLCRSAYLTSLWVPALAAAFPDHPASGDARTVRREVEDRIQRLHFLRNRIAHHEPIHRRDLRRDHQQLRELVGWICPDSQAWVGEASRSARVLGLRP
jgi:hypothetical protein